MSTQNVTPNASESSLSNIAHADNAIDLVARIVGIHEHQKQQAMAKLQGAVALQGAGFPVDTKAIMKFAKQAKLPIETDPEKLKAWLATQMDAKSGKSSAGGGGQEQQQGQPMTAPDGASPSHQEAVAIANRLQKGEKVDPSEIVGLRIKAMGEAMLKANNVAAATEQQKADNALQVESLKGQALVGDKGAVGKLMNGAGIPFNFDQAKWAALDDKGRADVMDVFEGHESKADFAARASRIGESMITSGRFSDPASAYKAGNIIASGGTLPAELTAKMKPYTFKELADSAAMMGDLVQLGVPPDKIGKVSSAAMAGGLENALPTGLKPLATQEMALKKAELGLEGARIGLEKERLDIEMVTAQRMDYLAQAKALSEKQKADIDNFKALVEIKKAGGKLDDDIIKGASVKAANALGMDAEEVNNTFHFLTGGTHLEFKPRLTDQGSSVVNKFSGKPNKAPEPSGLQSIINAVKNAHKEPI